MIARFNTLTTLSDAPDNCSYVILDSSGKLVSASESNELDVIATPTGSQIDVAYDMPNLAAGTYSIVFTIGDREFSQPLVLASSTRMADGIVTLNGMVDSDVPIESGQYILYAGNTELTNGVVNDSHVSINYSLPVSLDGNLLLLTDGTGAIADMQVYSINPTILTAMRELTAMVDRLQRELRLDALEMTDVDYLRALSHGRDRFNAIGPSSDISMLNAQGPIRQNWLLAAEIDLLRTRYLEESFTDYDYQGGAVSLSVDTRTALDDVISQLENRLTTEGPRLKTDMQMRGNLTGTGAWSARGGGPTAVGMSASLVSSAGYYGYGGRGYRNQFR